MRRLFVVEDCRVIDSRSKEIGISAIKLDLFIKINHLIRALFSKKIQLDLRVGRGISFHVTKTSTTVNCSNGHNAFYQQDSLK